jgi:hypothetical protein
MERIVLHASPRQMYRGLVLGLVGSTAGAAVLLLHISVWLGWWVVAVCGTYALIQLRSLGEETERVVIDDAGIRDSIFPVGVIGWSEVQGASVERVGSLEVVALKLRNPEQFIRRLPPVRQFIARHAGTAGLPAVYITLVGTDADPTRIAAVINDRSSRLRPKPIASSQ